MFEGLLVDLVPFDKPYQDLEYRWRNSEATYWSTGGERVILPRRVLEERFRRHAEERANGDDDNVMFGMQTKAGQPIGFVCINWLHTTYRTAMLGARIGEPEFWGGGYGTDALTLIVDYAFEWLDARRIWLMTTSMNARVMRQMEKVGFTLEARQREGSWADGRWVDWLAYGLLRDEWPGRAAMIEKIGLKAR